jgi:alkylhydroperoxidase family enzyme
VPTHIALGRGAGLSDEQIAHLADERLPSGVYDDAARAIIEYARRSTRMESIDDSLFDRLRRHLSLEQVMELCFTVGVANVINRFHATFLTDLDTVTLEELGSAPPLPLPPHPDTTPDVI